MGLLRRVRSPAGPSPGPLPLELPRLSGQGWPPRRRASFAVQTACSLAERRAHEPDATGVGERLVDALLPLVATGARADDAPYLRTVLLTAARLGAALGLLSSAAPGTLDRRTAGALWSLRATLPPMPAQQERLAAWFLLAGHWAARTDTVPHARALAALRAELARF